MSLYPTTKLKQTNTAARYFCGLTASWTGVNGIPPSPNRCRMICQSRRQIPSCFISWIYITNIHKGVHNNTTERKSHIEVHKYAITSQVPETFSEIQIEWYTCVFDDVLSLANRTSNRLILTYCDLFINCNRTPCNYIYRVHNGHNLLQRDL